jgi:hypothetical protein
LGDPQYDGGTVMARVIVVAEPETDPPGTDRDRRTFQLKERVTSSDMRDPHVAAQLIERIGWALADAEDAESRSASGLDSAGRTA